MRIPTPLAVLAAALCFVSHANAQEPKAPNPSEEDARLARIIERWLDANESEHDHVLREVMRGADKQIDDDFEQWFTRLGGDEDGWDRTRIQRKPVTEIFDRVAQYLEVKGPIVTYDQFIGYAKDHWPAHKSSVWRTPPPFDAIRESAKLFKRLDNDLHFPRKSEDQESWEGYLRTSRFRHISGLVYFKKSRAFQFIVQSKEAGQMMTTQAREPQGSYKLDYSPPVPKCQSHG